MAHKTLRLSVGSIFPKGPGKIYFYRYQLDGHRKTGKEVTIPIADELLAVLLESRQWQSDGYVCPKTAERYNHLDKDGKNMH